MGQRRSRGQQRGRATVRQGRPAGRPRGGTRAPQRSVAARTASPSTHADVRTWPQLALATLPTAVAFVVWTPGLNDIEPPKLLLTVAVAGICLAAVLVRALWARELVVPTGPFAAALMAGILGLFIAAVASGRVQTGLFGTRARHDGVLLYLAAGICALVAARVLGRDPEWRLVYLKRLAVGGGVIAGIGLLQAAGYFPFGMRSDLDGAFSTLGNPNFLAGWAGAVSGVPLALLLWERHLPAGVKWGLLWLVVLAGAAASGSTQWVASAGASCAAAVTLWVVSRTRGRARTVLVAGMAMLGLAGVAALGAGLAGAGPLRGISGDIGTRLRGHYWRAAWQMAGDSPITGVGPGRFIWEYRGARSTAATAEVSISSVADAAHNVWLNFLAVGGLLTVLPFIAVLLLSGWAIRRLLRQVDATSPDRVAIAGLAAVEAGYLVQSLVSIEVPSLVVLHLMTAGVLAGAAGTVGWWPVATRVPGSAGLRAAVAGIGGLAIVVVAVLVAGRPLVAEQSAQAGVRGPDAGAVAALRTTTARAPWDPYYQELLGTELLNHDDLDAALAVLARSDALADPNGTARYIAATAAAQADRQAQASELFTAALEAEPNHPELLVRYSRFQADNGRVDEALATLEEVLARFPDQADARQLQDELRRAAA